MSIFVNDFLEDIVGGLELLSYLLQKGKIEEGVF